MDICSAPKNTHNSTKNARPSVIIIPVFKIFFALFSLTATSLEIAVVIPKVEIVAPRAYTERTS